MSILSGKRIVITRAMHQAEEFEQLLRECAAIPLLYPCLSIIPPTDDMPLRRALADAMDGNFDWLLLTSTNTVRALEQQFKIMGDSVVFPAHLQVAAVGSSTAEAAKRFLGVGVSFIPEKFNAETLAQMLPLAAGKRILLPQSAIAATDLVDHLSSQGLFVTSVTAYRTVIGQGGVDLVGHLNAGTIDALTFTSASTVTNFVQRLTAEGGSISQLSSVCIACIGLKTVGAAALNNLPPHVIAATHTLHGLVMALETFYNENNVGEPK